MSLNIHAPEPEVLTWARTCGCQWARTTFYVDLCHQQPEKYAEFLTGLRAFNTAGLKTLVVVHSLGEDAYGTEMPDVLRELVTRAREDAGVPIAALQIGNECNDTNRQSPFLRASSQYERGKEYGRLYWECRVALVSAVPLVVAGLVGDPSEFLEGMKAVKVTPDRIGVHVYGLPLLADTITNAVTGARRVFPTVPIWITEMGSEGGKSLSPAGEAQQLEDMATAIATLSHAEFSDVLAFWYCAAGDWPYALLRETTDGSAVERPAGRRYRETRRR